MTMLAAFKRLFDPQTVAGEDQRKERLAIAGALLMLEVASADFELADAEHAVLRDRMRRHFDGSAQALDDLIEEAMAQHDVSVSLHQQVDLLNDLYDAQDKRELIRDLWRLAYADGELHHYEEGVIRRLAELLYVPHRDFIQTKLDVVNDK